PNVLMRRSRSLSVATLEALPMFPKHSVPQRDTLSLSLYPYGIITIVISIKPSCRMPIRKLRDHDSNASIPVRRRIHDMQWEALPALARRHDGKDETIQPC